MNVTDADRRALAALAEAIKDQPTAHASAVARIL